MGKLQALGGLLLAACVCAHSAAPALRTRTSVAPTLLWSTGGQYFAGPAHQGDRVAYEEVPAHVVMGPVLGELLGMRAAGHALLDSAALQQQPPQLVVIILGDKLSAEALARGGKAFEPLQAAQRSAGARLSLPNVAHRPGSNLTAQALAVAAAAGMAGRAHTLGACAPGAAPASAGALQALLAHTPPASGTQAVVVCAGADNAAQEAALVGDLAEAAAADGRRSVFLYAAQPPAQAERARARSLLSAPGQSYVCDAKCETQVRLLEALILSVTLISALLSGTCMLHALCTPTRFEAPKGERAHGDS